MLLLVSIMLAAGILLAAQRYGTTRVLPATGLLCVAAAVLFDASVGVAPLMGLIAAVQVERRCPYGQIIAVAAGPGAALAVWVLLTHDARDRSEVAAALTEQLEGMGMQAAEGTSGLREMVALIVRVQPGLEFVSLLFTAVLAYRVAVWAAPRIHLVLPPGRPFHLWRPWDELIWVITGGLALSLAAPGRLRDVGLNVGLVMGIIYAVQGLSVLRFFLRRVGVARLLELMLYVLLFLTSGVSLLLLVGLGLLDTWFDWRRLRPAASGEDSE